jgi:hypothetical protein
LHVEGINIYVNSKDYSHILVIKFNFLKQRWSKWNFVQISDSHTWHFYMNQQESNTSCKEKTLEI